MIFSTVVVHQENKGKNEHSHWFHSQNNHSYENSYDNDAQQNSEDDRCKIESDDVS